MSDVFAIIDNFGQLVGYASSEEVAVDTCLKFNIEILEGFYSFAPVSSSGSKLEALEKVTAKLTDDYRSGRERHQIFSYEKLERVGGV